MPKNDWIYVGHMLDLCKKGLELSSGISRSEFDQNELLPLALTHIIQMIGEAAARISEDFKAMYPQILWHEIIGTRHHIVHDYMNVDYDIVWTITTDELNQLYSDLMQIIPPDLE